MKQGDPLSCVIFIICIDPLIRNINADRIILALELKTRITKEKVKYKSGAFADDVGAVCRGDANSAKVKISPKYMILFVVKQLQIHGPPLGLALYLFS